MPTDPKLIEALKKLSLSLGDHCTRRLEKEESVAKELKEILTKISDLINEDQDNDIKVDDLGQTFFNCIHPPPFPPQPLRGAKD